jgi:tetratricopeptide (TPR) repeat protein
MAAIGMIQAQQLLHTATVQSFVWCGATKRHTNLVGMLPRSSHLLFAVPTTSTANNNIIITKTTQQKLRNAMAVTTAAFQANETTASATATSKTATATTAITATNISKAYEACSLWDALEISTNLPVGPVRVLASVLYATCLVRVGRDTDAIDVYDECFNSCYFQEQEQPKRYFGLEPNTWKDARMGKALALQRLMRYEEAIPTFLETITSSATTGLDDNDTDDDDSDDDHRGILGAITCCLRLGDLERAVRILDEMNRLQQQQLHRRRGGVEVRAMEAVLKMMLKNTSIETSTSGGLTSSTNAAATPWNEAALTFPLFHWIAEVTSEVIKRRSRKYDHLQVAAINQSPLDDPLLLELDDKVKLHKLLASQNMSFWPAGYIVPDELHVFRYQHVEGKRQSSNHKDWILKSRAGYGSHGNQITTAWNVVNTTADHWIEPRLCQRLVEPPLLLNNRKFSMRVYVYYFTDGSVYLSTLGLVKLATEHYRKGSDDDGIHMTNSGREESMVQYDFHYLRDQFQNAGWSYATLWADITTAVKDTMTCYNDSTNEGNSQTIVSKYRRGLARLGIPKILGFDFMVTESLQPMLLEVNRFPGLEPRGDGDEQVKLAVVREAWVCAASRLGVTGIVDQSPVGGFLSYNKII